LGGFAPCLVFLSAFVIGGKNIKRGLDDEGPRIREDFVEVRKVESTVANSALAGLQFILVEIRMRLLKVDPGLVLELFPTS